MHLHVKYTFIFGRLLWRHFPTKIVTCGNIVNSSNIGDLFNTCNKLFVKICFFVKDILSLFTFYHAIGQSEDCVIVNYTQSKLFCSSNRGDFTKYTLRKLNYFLIMSWQSFTH